MTFVVRALTAETFAHLTALTPEELAARGVETHVADASPGYPCRVSLRDAEPGERLYLVNHTHHDVHGPYRASHAVFVRAGAETASPAPNDIPDMLRRRHLAVRGFDRAGAMVDATLTDGADARAVFERMLARADVAVLHVHNAARGCYLASVHRLDHATPQRTA